MGYECLSTLQNLLNCQSMLLLWFSDPRDVMSRFVMGVSDDLNEECCTDMLHDNMNISCLMVHAQKVEETRVKRKNRDFNRARSE